MFLKDEFGCGVVNRERSEGIDWRQRGEEQTKSDGDLNQAQSRGGGEKNFPVLANCLRFGGLLHLLARLFAVMP